VRKLKSGESGENLKNQLLKSGDFLSGEKYENQETPGEIRRFGNPGAQSKFSDFDENSPML
jgi:hypothetical protein